MIYGREKYFKNWKIELNYHKNKIYYKKKEMRTIETNIEYILFVSFQSYSFQLLEHSFFLLSLFLLFLPIFLYFFFLLVLVQEYVYRTGLYMRYIVSEEK